MKKYYETAAEYGMCGGVFSALATLEKALAESDSKSVFVLHELVHNHAVTADLESRGVHFVNTPDEVPPGSELVIGAHGVSAAVEKELAARAGKIFDATCPLVKRLHRLASQLDKKDQLVIFGKHGHAEVAGVAGHSKAGATYIVSNAEDIEALPELENPFFISQTTVDAAEVDAAEKQLKKRFPALRCASGVCDASKKRQLAVYELAKNSPLVIIVGSAHSSNVCRLKEIAERAGAKVFRIDNASELPIEELKKISKAGVSSGASTPETLFEEVLAVLRENGFEPLK